MTTKDYLEKDYYAILGVKKDATPAEIKKAFRKLARENHPDQHPGDKQAEKRFKEASEAHDVLSDPDKRKEYDSARAMFGSGFRFPGTGGRTGGAQANFNLDDLFGQFSGAGGTAGGGLGSFFDFFGGGAERTSRSRGPRRGHDLEGEATVSFRDAAEGVTVSLPLTSDAACPTCHGTSFKQGTSPKTCPQCQGSGTVSRQSGGFAVSEPCSTCRGRGLVGEDCPDCAGTGRAKSTQTVQVRLPAGVSDGQRIRVKGKGGAGAGGGAAGDLYVVVHVRPHRLFGRSGDNLTLTVPVTFAEATLGAEIEVPTLAGGTVKLRVPAGTPNGRTFRVRGKGIQKKDGVTDLMVTVEVQVPHHLSAEAKAALEQFASLSHEPDPRAALKAGV
ncbi:MAG: molecular chaperone DnaJ [Propionibacteriaceae bacterium]|nr:molecular chaperone DnaJ [Propionibacteriaceae bacterium]